MVNITLPDIDNVRLGPNASRALENKVCKVLLRDGALKTNGDTFTITLDAFEVLQIQDPCDLTGTMIESSEPVAVFTGNVRANVGEGSKSRDHLVEQIQPVENWGYDCLGTPTPGRSVGDYWSVTAAKSGTIVEIWTGSNIKDVVELELPGSTFRFKAPSYTNLHFKATKPIQVISYVHSQLTPEEEADPSMTICTSTAQFDYQYTFALPTDRNTKYHSFMTIVIADGKQNKLLLDGAALPEENWKGVPNSGWVTAHFQLPPNGVHSVTHTMKGTRFGAYIYGAGDRSSFAYPLGTCTERTSCDLSLMEVADGRDNDCDNLIDEEICDGDDDDGDGIIDEDCYVSRFVTTEQLQQQLPPMGRPFKARKAKHSDTRVTLAPEQIVKKQKQVEKLQPESESSMEQCFNVRRAVGCYNAKLTLDCEENHRVKVLSAHFGRIGYRDEYTCGAGNMVDFDGREIQCGFQDVYWPIAQFCDNETSCSYHVHLYELGDIAPGNQRCQLCHQYVHVHYLCVDPGAHSWMNLAGRMGAELATRYRASSWSFGSMSTANSQCTSDSKVLPNGRQHLPDSSAPSSARFSSGAIDAWCPAFCDRQDGWLIVDLGGYFEVTGYMIQGRRSEEQWISSIRLAYSSDAVSWTELRSLNGTWMVLVLFSLFFSIIYFSYFKSFPGNYDARSIVACHLTQYKIVARFMRVIVGAYSGQPCLHIDFFRKSRRN